jgi:hypothetical protein
MLRVTRCEIGHEVKVSARFPGLVNKNLQLK